MTSLYIRNLVKRYDDGTEALKGIDLDVNDGDFFALLGPNGAGKSTTIGIVSQLVNPTSGKVVVEGHNIALEPMAAKASIGLVPQEVNFGIFEPVQSILHNVAGFNGIGMTEARRRSEYYLKKLELWDKRRTAARFLSGGMKRRLMIARALVHEPKLLILDEPTAGVDIEIRRSMWELLVDLNRDQGISIILTTHYLEEAEALCRNVAIIDQGEIVEQGSVAELLSRARVETFVLDIKGDIDDNLAFDPYVLRRVDDNRVEVDVPQGQKLNGLFDLLSRSGVEVMSLRNKANRLEAFFINLVESRRQGRDTSSHAEG